jgi:site-specific DNA-methyltransferase (adenine-specific)
MERDIDAASTYAEIRRLERQAEAIKVLHREIEDVRQKAEWVILVARRRVGEELEKAPVARGGGDQRSNHRVPAGSGGPATLAQQVGSQKRGVNLKKLAALAKGELKKAAEALWDAGKEATQTAILKVFSAADKAALDDQRRNQFAAIRSELPSDLHVGDFRTLAHAIPDDSADLVFTDPPYDDESLPLYEDAAKEAARILKPGGSLITYCGHLLVPKVLPLMSAHLRYYWIGAHVHDGGQMSRMTHYGVIVGFKPLLWFVKGDRRFDKRTFVEDTVLVKREKGTHPWQQAVATAEHFIKALTVEGGTVVDFFAGGGTTMVAARNLNRKWIAFEIDEKAVPGIMTRMAEAAE